MDFYTDREVQIKQYKVAQYKQEKTFGIPWKSDKLEDFEVYRIPAKIISFNFDNARIAAEKNTVEGKLGRSLDPKKSEDQKIVQKILLESVWYDKKDTEQLMKSLKVQQRNPAILTFDGVAIDGNRRIACLNSLHDEKGNPQYSEIDVCILQKTGKKEIIMLENRLQLAKDYKVEYGPINDRLRVRDMVNEKFTDSEIIHSVNGRYSKADIKKMVEEMNLIDKYLKSIGKEQDYAHIAGKTESFVNLRDALKLSSVGVTSATKLVEKEKLQMLGFQYIAHPHSTYQHIRKFRDVLKKPQARKELLENSETFMKPAIGKHFEPDKLGNEWVNLEFAHGFVDKEKTDPKKLVKIAIQKLEMIDKERILSNDKELKKLLEEIEKMTISIKKKLF